ncbi:hypothetical protein ACFVZR_02145 [Streptomyces sp. NPDC058316]|uniref:hypothetical protein n=1 Tax=Streptomyces sp. NPDC058316 TaxID=3346442 RepID=UPI0036EF5063
MTEPDSPASVRALRITAKVGPETLDNLTLFFDSLNGLYGYAVALEHIAGYADRDVLSGHEIEKIFYKAEHEAPRPSVKDLSMRSPLDLLLIDHWGGHAAYLVALAALLRAAPNAVSNVAVQRAKWHKWQLETDKAKILREELKRSLGGGDIDPPFTEDPPPDTDDE